MWKKDESSLVNLVDDISGRDMLDIPDDSDLNNEIVVYATDQSTIQEATAGESRQPSKIKSLRLIHSDYLSSIKVSFF